MKKAITKKSVINRLNRKFRALEKGRKCSVSLQLTAQTIKASTHIRWSSADTAEYDDHDMQLSIDDHQYKLYNKLYAMFDKAFLAATKQFDKPIKDVVAESDFYADHFGEKRSTFWDRVMDNDWE
jgi:TnpA family transposase